MEELTPIRKQYLQLKSKYADTILFFRLGDFYETFDSDAETISRELDIVLTSRPVGKNQRVPLAGVPYHAVDGYIARLIEKGYRVAIAEQLGTEPVKGLVPREVTRVVTPGTVVEPALLDERRPNYLAALVQDEDRLGLAYADITTGEFAATQFSGDKALPAAQQELNRLAPRECLIIEVSSFKFQVSGAGQPSGALPDPSCVPDLQSEIKNQKSKIHFTPLPAWKFEYGNARQALLDHFQVSTLQGLGCEGQPLAVRAAGAIIQYLRETQIAGVAQITSLSTYSTAAFMTLDPATRRNLELTEAIRGGGVRGSLLDVLDATRTPMGARLLRIWLGQPLLDRPQIEERLERVSAFYKDTSLRVALRETLKNMPDLERLCTRVLGSVATPRDLGGIRRALKTVQEARSNLREVDSLAALVAQLDVCEDVIVAIEAALVDDPPPSVSAGGAIRPGFSAELDGVLAASRDAKDWIANLEKTERQRTGIRSLKVGYNKVFGYYLEVTATNVDAVPPDYIRKQTLANAERYITPALKEYESLVLNAEERIAEIEARLFRELCAQVAARADRLLRTARVIACLDVAADLAEIAACNAYVCPTLADEDEIHIVDGRHPVVEQTLGELAFVPNDLHLDADTRLLVITGPNMSGKSVYLRQAALVVLMAQIGSFVPAREARLGVVDRIFTRIGAQDEIAAGQSTFMVEMVETALAVTQCTPRSLIVFDEIGRGTSTYDGMAIAWAVVEFIHNHPAHAAKTLFATHYHELAELEARLPRVRNVNAAVAEEAGTVVFLHHIRPGAADKSYGVHVAQLAGLPKPVIRRAQDILEQLEKGELVPRKEEDVPSAVQQMSFFSGPDPALAELKKMDLNSLSPLEALNKLYELQRLVR
ncbi:MAG: DNA mismatch repair protein MutS [Thermoflexales bacterium]|nr:DNA mismatch repair protein MutS [Thermoflexales bacterium]